MLEIKGLSKKYGDETALRGLSLVIDGKGILGILGDKGSGKTTMARVICGCENGDCGEISLDGEAMSRSNLTLKRKVRLVPSDIELYGVTTPCEYLDFVGEALGVLPDKRYRQIKEALELTGLENVQNAPFSTLNKCHRTLLSLAAALIGNPEMIVLDTPFGGIEGKQLSTIYDILGMLAKIKTVVLMSRKPSEVKKLCENIAILHEGKIVVSGSISDIEKKLNATSQIYITVRGEKERVIDAINGVDTVMSVRVHSSEPNNVNVYSVEHRHDDKMKDKLFSALSDINAPMLSVRSVTLTIDDVFYSFASSKNEEKEEEKKPLENTDEKRRNKR